MTMDFEMDKRETERRRQGERGLPTGTRLEGDDHAVGDARSGTGRVESGNARRFLQP